MERTINNKKWLSVDLHIHSQYSTKRKKDESSRVKEMPAKEMVDILKDHFIDIFSVTDHNYFSSEYYKELQSYINENDIEMELIYGAELDTYIENEEGKYIHICVYFDKTINTEELENTINKLYEDDGEPTLYDIIEKLNTLNSKYIIIPHGNKQR